MAGKRERSNGTWEFQFERKGLLKRTSRTFDTEADGIAYALSADKLLNAGIVPVELRDSKFNTVRQLLNTYEACETLKVSARDLLPTLCNTIGDTRLQDVNNKWLDTWIMIMKQTLAPSTLKKRVELLARAIDWGMRKDMLVFTNNPLRLLPKGYASDGASHERDRRLSETGVEEGAIRKALVKKEESLLFDMALESAMRMREMYTLTKDQVSLDKETIFLERTKNGDKRQVPMSSVLKKLLTEHLSTLKGEQLFPWWSGSLDEDYLKGLTNRLSQMYARRFALAGCADLTFHDLRHEATSRIYERTTLTDLEVASITGHKDPRMLKRYANLRGSKLARKLW